MTEQAEAYPSAEHRRLAEDACRRQNWKRWGPYLAERQWGTVREDYSPDGDVWSYFTHEMARSRAYRWGEDGLLGWCDRQCRLCFKVALWNGRDPILKERLFGLTGPEGNHGEDVKELYYYLDATPTYTYARALYKYPQAPFPYEALVRVNARRGREEPEYEITDTGVFDEDRYFDVEVEYAKAGPGDILVRLNVVNRGPEPSNLVLLPTLWFRNTWIWGCEHEGCTLKPRLEVSGPGAVLARHESLPPHVFQFEEAGDGAPELLFTDNESNVQKLWGGEGYTPYVKDAFHRYVVDGERGAVNPQGHGTQAAMLYRMALEPGRRRTVRLRLHEGEAPLDPAFGEAFDRVFEGRRGEADAFYAAVLPPGCSEEEARVQRQAYAGLLWTKQFYHYSVRDWMRGDPDVIEPPPERWQGRNQGWRHHLFNRDVISMPDTWEYPWYAAWDLAFHMIPFADIDPDFARQQLVLLLREWYMHPNGQIPAYEFSFDDVNPPVHAWACWRVYRAGAAAGQPDVRFLAATFHKLLINFTWWVNRKDPHGRNLFAGGFLGLDNIGVFDRSEPLPSGQILEQSDATAWMAFYCLTMLNIALELAVHDAAYEGVASKFFEHFVAIADATNALGGDGLWDEGDGFYYDQILTGQGAIALRIRSLVGLIPLCAVGVLTDEVLARLPRFRKRMDWFLQHRQDLRDHVAYMDASADGAGRRLLAVPNRHRLERMLRYLLDENEFLSPYGIRSLSRVHRDRPFTLSLDGREDCVRYAPAEAESGMFGGNSNWRGPVWFPINYLLIESLRTYHTFYGDGFRTECPVGSGRSCTLSEVADELARRLVRIFLPEEGGRRPCHGAEARYARDPHFKDLVLFYEYFHGDTGRGCGASHQTGWTALVASLLRDLRRPGP